MKFLNAQNEEVNLVQSDVMPGYEVTLNKDVLLESPINNSFFKGLKGVNILQLPKKMKGFRDNPDIEHLLEPTLVNIDLKIEVEKNQVIIFQPNMEVLRSNKLHAETQLFGSMASIVPSIFNYGLHNVKLEKDTVIGNIIVLNSIL